VRNLGERGATGDKSSILWRAFMNNLARSIVNIDVWISSLKDSRCEIIVMINL